MADAGCLKTSAASASSTMCRKPTRPAAVVPEADKTCCCCQTPRVKIGEETSEQLEILKDFKGFLQADAANVFDGFYRPGDIIEAGCWAHARRYFHDARTSDAARAAEALARIGFFYDVEREAKKIIDEQELDGDQADALRLKMRQERTLPKLREFADWLDAQAYLGPSQKPYRPGHQLCSKSLAGTVAVHAARLPEHRQQRL
jgi:hypothetical protein